MSAGDATIKLNGTEIAITQPVEIIGPTSAKLTIDADQKSRVFQDWRFGLKQFTRNHDLQFAIGKWPINARRCDLLDRDFDYRWFNDREQFCRHGWGYLLDEYA